MLSSNRRGPWSKGVAIAESNQTLFTLCDLKSSEDPADNLSQPSFTSLSQTQLNTKSKWLI